MRNYIISFVIFSTIVIPIIIINQMDKQPSMQVVELKSEWQFRQFGKNEWLKATVPGTVHTDLIANGKIEDPFYRDNEQKQIWIEGEDWEYRTLFDIDKEAFKRQNIDIIFKGLDTYADVFINDKLIKSTDNMFVAYTIPCKEFLKIGSNSLRILFHSPTNVGLKKLNESPYLVPAVNEFAPDDKRTSVFTRKAPYHYGWDWGPRIVTSGVWRPIYLQVWDVAKITTTYHELKKLYSHEADYETAVEIQATDKGKGELEVLLNGEKVASEKDRKSTRLNSSHSTLSRMPSSA